MSDPYWIEKATANKGALHRATHTPAGQDIPARKIDRAADSSKPKVAAEARLAETLDHLRPGATHHKAGASNGETHVADVLRPAK